jgi:hypothetical protein
MRSLTLPTGVLGVVMLCGVVIAGQGATPDAQGVIRVTPDDVVFPGGSGAQSVVIAGDPTKPGIYVLRNRFPPHVMSQPHFHNQDRFVTVIKGTWWTAVGPGADVFNPDKTQPLSAGGFMKHPAGVHHYDGAKDTEVIVQIIGMGPVTTTPVGGGDSNRPPDIGWGHPR